MITMEDIFYDDDKNVLYKEFPKIIMDINKKIKEEKENGKD